MHCSCIVQKQIKLNSNQVLKENANDDGLGVLFDKSDSFKKGVLKSGAAFAD
ncbi:hypothetical protein YC2023_075773 [Brassica napus]